MTNVIEQFAPYPKTEDEATAEAIYRYLLVAAQVTCLARVRPFTMPGRPDDPEQHLAAVAQFISEWSTLHLMRHLLGHGQPQDGDGPDASPDEVARDMWIGWEDGGGPAEALWEWLEEAGFDPEAIDEAYRKAAKTAAEATS
jgi:hypothetical protein